MLCFVVNLPSISSAKSQNRSPYSTSTLLKFSCLPLRFEQFGFPDHRHVGFVKAVRNGLGLPKEVTIR